MVLLPSAYLTPSPSSVTTPPSQHPALRNASAKIISGYGCLSYDSTGVTSGTGRRTQGRVNRGVQDRWRSAARWTLIGCRASAPFPGRHGGDGAESSNRALGVPWEAVSGRYEIPWVYAKDGIGYVDSWICATARLLWAPRRRPCEHNKC